MGSACPPRGDRARPVAGEPHACVHSVRVDRAQGAGDATREQGQNGGQLWLLAGVPVGKIRLSSPPSATALGAVPRLSRSVADGALGHNGEKVPLLWTRLDERHVWPWARRWRKLQEIPPAPTGLGPPRRCVTRWPGSQEAVCPEAVTGMPDVEATGRSLERASSLPCCSEVTLRTAAACADQQPPRQERDPTALASLGLRPAPGPLPCQPRSAPTVRRLPNGTRRLPLCILPLLW